MEKGMIKKEDIDKDKDKPRDFDGQGNHGVGTLMRAWNAGNNEAFDALIRRVMPWLNDYVHGQLGDRLRAKVETQDVIQDAVTNFLKYAPRFAVEHDDQLRALVRQIANNVIRGHHRYFQCKRRELALERPLSGVTTVVFAGGTPSQVVMADDREARVRLALEMLEPLEQRIVCMRVYEDQSFRQIGATVKLAEDATRMRFNRALRKLETKVSCMEKNDIWSFLEQ